MSAAALSRSTPWARRVLLVAAAATALVAVLAGLARLGLVVPLAARAPEHGPLFVVGTFGTIIALERAVALGQPWAYGAPALGALQALLALARVGPPALAPWLGAGACAWLAVVNAAIVRRQAAAFTWTMLLGSVALAGGTLAWALGRYVFDVAPTWLAFFVLTIAAERLELSRLAPRPPWATGLFVALAVLFAGAAAAASAGVAGAPRAVGALLVGLAAWQLRFDLARRTVRRPGLPRFTALGVLAGTGWLLVAGALLVAGGLPPAGPWYDAVLHAVFVGFALSMVFAHAPIILPAVARLDLPFHPLFYVPLAVLHAGLAARIAGDVLLDMPLRSLGAVTNAFALALFMVTAVTARLLARRAPAP